MNLMWTTCKIHGYNRIAFDGLGCVYCEHRALFAQVEKLLAVLKLARVEIIAGLEYDFNSSRACETLHAIDSALGEK